MNQAETPEGKFGAAIFGLAIVFCSQEMVPGWGMFHLGWPPAAFYGIMGLCGAVSGLLMATYRVPGSVGGAIAGVGSLYAMGAVLERVDSIHSAILILVGLLGALPGIGLYHLLRLFIEWLEQPERKDE